MAALGSGAVRASRALLAALLAAAVACSGACSGEGGDETVIPAVDVPVSLPDVPPPPPECDPTADPTGCEDGALCWFERCAPLAEQTVPAGEQAVVGAVASLADEKGGAVVAWHERTAPAAGATARTDRVLAAFLQGDTLGETREVARWETPLTGAEGAGPAGPALALVRGPGEAVTIVRGPDRLVAWRWRAGSWSESAALTTGARLVLSEGSFATAADAEGRLHVAYHDLQTETLDIATLGPEGEWTTAKVYDLATHFGVVTVWGVRLTGTVVDGRAVFALVLESEDNPRVKRGAIVVEQGAAGWEISTPGLADGLVIEGLVTGLAAATDAEGRLTLAWLPFTRQLGVAVRGADGVWTRRELPNVSRTSISDEVHDNLSIRWWQDAVVYAWLGEPKTECACFDVRLAMVRGDRWLEYRARMFGDRLPGDLDLAIDDRGRLLLPVGGGPFPDRGTSALTLLVSALPDWTTTEDTARELIREIR